MREQQFNNNHKIYIKIILLCAEKLKKKILSAENRTVVNITVPTPTLTPTFPTRRESVFVILFMYILRGFISTKLCFSFKVVWNLNYIAMIHIQFHLFMHSRLALLYPPPPLLTRISCIQIFQYFFSGTHTHSNKAELY